MATDAENLASIKSGYLAQLAEDAASKKGRASYSIDNQSVSRNEWRAGLLQAIKDIDELLASPAVQGPWEIRTKARA